MLLLQLSPNPPGCNPNPPGCYPNSTGCNPNPLGCYPNPPGCNPNPQIAIQIPRVVIQIPQIAIQIPRVVIQIPRAAIRILRLVIQTSWDNISRVKTHILWVTISLNHMGNNPTHNPMSGNPGVTGNNPNAMGYKPSNIPYIGASCMFPESTRGATWINLKNSGIRDQGSVNGMYAAEQVHLLIPLESHFL